MIPSSEVFELEIANIDMVSETTTATTTIKLVEEFEERFYFFLIQYPPFIVEIFNSRGGPHHTLCQTSLNNESNQEYCRRTVFLRNKIYIQFYSQF